MERSAKSMTDTERRVSNSTKAAAGAAVAVAGISFHSEHSFAVVVTRQLNNHMTHICGTWYNVQRI